MTEIKSFDYKEDDVEGLATLESIANADKLNEWMYNEVAPYASGRVLEIGSGIGNISKFFIINNWDITLTDIRDHYCDKLRDRFSDHSNLREVRNIDLVHANFENEYPDILNSFDFIFALNVVEHIEEHELALANAKKLLTKEGKVFILVPAFQTLYNQFDKELYHYRRYNK
ncbi:MAG: class I SAM-dependent methyltransferase, partial [Bacteroidia bacterium]|nr:class I SAM-dependent methyltransferase [Bacteroidia bacterium]